MNIQNISALVKQLQLIGLEDVSYSLLKRISFKPSSFYLSQKIERGKDLINLQLFFEKRKTEDVYDLMYYDAIFQPEVNFTESLLNGVNINSLEKQMAGIDWKKAFELDERKVWNADDKTSWEKEQKIESIVSELSALETTEEGKTIAAALKLKYWSGASYHELFENISLPKNKAEVSQRFYFFEGQTGISIDEAYRFLQNRRLEKQILVKKKQTDIPQSEDTEGDQSNTSGSGLLRKRRINGGVRSKKNKLINH